MAVKQRTTRSKSHMISFRIGSTEYRLLKALQPLHGASSFSDFARNTLLRQLAVALEEPGRHAPVDDLGTRVNLLQRDLDRLRALLQEPRPDS